MNSKFILWSVCHRQYAFMSLIIAFRGKACTMSRINLHCDRVYGCLLTFPSKVHSSKRINILHVQTLMLRTRLYKNANKPNENEKEKPYHLHEEYKRMYLIKFTFRIKGRFSRMIFCNFKDPRHHLQQFVFVWQVRQNQAWRI